MTSLVYKTLLDLLRDDGYSIGTVTVWYQGRFCGYAEATKNGNKWCVIASDIYEGNI